MSQVKSSNLHGFTLLLQETGAIKAFVQAGRNSEDDEICEFKLYCCYPYLA